MRYAEDTCGPATERPVRRRTILAIAGAVTALFIVANTHLVWVAFRSQPDCVDHLRVKAQSGAFRAAQSSC